MVAIDDFSASFLMSVSSSTHKTPSEIIIDTGVYVSAVMLANQDKFKKEDYIVLFPHKGNCPRYQGSAQTAEKGI